MAIAGASFTTYNKKTFSKIHLFVQDKVDEVAQKRVENMKNALIFRRYLSGESKARYPKSDVGTKGRGRGGEGHSFAAWVMLKKKSAHYTLSNTHANAVDDFPYPRMVAYGTSDTNSVWWKSVEKGTNKKLVFNDGKVFTKDLPKGLTPFFRRQKALLKQEMNAITDDWNNR